MLHDLGERADESTRLRRRLRVLQDFTASDDLLAARLSMELHVILCQKSVIALPVGANEADVGALCACCISLIHTSVGACALASASWAALLDELPVAEASCARRAGARRADVAGIQNKLFANYTRIEDVLKFDLLRRCRYNSAGDNGSA